MNEKITNFYEWLYLKYQAAKEYGDIEEWGVWEEVVDKFNKIFNEN